MIETVDNLILRLEQLMASKCEAQSGADEAEDTTRLSILNKPLGELSPHSRREVQCLLQEAADNMDVSGIDIDDTHSSIELVWSIIKEAGRRFGFGEDDWPKKMMNEQNLTFREEDTIKSENVISAGTGFMYTTFIGSCVLCETQLLVRIYTNKISNLLR